jgi:hypothetical protein
MNSDTQQQLERLVDALENQDQAKTDMHRSFLTQPERVFITSDDDISQSVSQEPQTENSFASFTVNLKRPALNVKSLQVSRVSIPNATSSCIPDNECIFWYYRIPSITNTGSASLQYPTPGSFDTAQFYQYLYYVRLLPTTYKKDFVYLFRNWNNRYTPSSFTYNEYGFNKVYQDYQELSDELGKSCNADLAYDMLSDLSGEQIFGAPTVRGVWSALTTYALGDVVSYNPGNNLNNKSIFYQSQINSNINQNPFYGSGQAYWKVYLKFLPNDVLIEYDSTQNRFVLTGNNITQSSLYPATNFYYISAGYNDPNILTASQELYNITKIWDFPLLPGPWGQPYFQYKTLNLRLGFSWDGNSRTIPTQAILGSVNSSYFSLLNRFRPSFWYQQVAPPATSLTLAPPSLTVHPTTFFIITARTLANSYTAECPANLVYTSIVNLYADIAGGSTSDSGEKGQALLATVPMQSGTLGVVFYNPTIYNALTKISDQIYQITIEMRTENGNLFYLPNSAIVTLEFTLTY